MRYPTMWDYIKCLIFGHDVYTRQDTTLITCNRCDKGSHM